MITQEQQKKYNKTAYQKLRNDPIKWAKQLAKGRERYSIIGHKKVPSICIVCGKKWLGVVRKRNFCSQKCVSQGTHNGRWLGGRQVTVHGYVRIYSPHHPNAIRNLVAEHRLVMEKHLGRFLQPKEVVHHINGKRDDNRIENLELMSNQKHSSIHSKGHRYNKICLTQDQIDFIRKNYVRNGKTNMYALAKKLGVTQGVIMDVIHKRGAYSKSRIKDWGLS